MSIEAIGTIETQRRSVTKSLIWRFIGIVWTWIGAYLIILFAPERFRTAVWISTFIVIYHHSTRMVMYYFYERLWSKIRWGRSGLGSEATPPLTVRVRMIWTFATLAILAILFFLILYVAPLLKGK